MKSMSTTAMVETLTTIWLRVLQLRSVGVDDNFFDLGGDSALALELFNEVALACGVELPPVAIYQAPTIAALAAALEHPSGLRIPPAVQLKAGSEKTPVFIAHGLGGSAMDFYQVVKHIDAPHAIYGLQAKGIDGAEDPLDRIEDMARCSLDAVRRLQPHGPYLLVGFSLGGLVAMEMAQQLVAGGERVGLLVMLDSYPHMSYLAPVPFARLATQLGWRWLAGRLQWLGVKKPYQTTVDTLLTPALHRSRESDKRALKHYRPRYYPGKINFVRAAIPTDFPADAAAVWRDLASSFELESVPGDHLGMMTVQYESLAAAITRCLQAASL